MRIRRILYFAGAFFLILVKFTADIIGKNAELEISGLGVVRIFSILGAFVLLFLAVESVFPRRDQNPVRKLGVQLFLMVGIGALGVVLGAIPVGGFDAKNLSLLPLDYPTIFVASLLGLSFGVWALVMLRSLRDLVLYQRKKGTMRNFVILVALILAAAASAMFLKPLDTTFLTGVFTTLAVLFALVNSFRLPWVLYLTKREKIFALIFTLLLFVGFVLINTLLLHTSSVSRSLLYYSSPLKVFVDLVAMFANIFFGMAFISTLFHLPTAEAFDRKRSEVASLHNLSRLITQVFDFNELVETVTSMTLDVCQASSSWLEIMHTGEEAVAQRAAAQMLLEGGDRSEDLVPAAAPADGHTAFVQIAGMKNITAEEIGELIGARPGNLREAVMAERKPLVVDDIAGDPRFVHLRKSGTRHASLVVVPLVAHGAITGILYATKSAKYGFVKDDVDVISTFADQATIAIENSRLIKKSLERERLIREMLVAQEMQRKLLPQTLPQYPQLDLGAVSMPAFEVGGDYYDCVELAPDRFGLIVGDVSGKGVPAAFYMSVVKGIFQALGKTCESPREFMIKANDALAGSIDKHSFVSLMYAIVDVGKGTLTVARAGHCPLLRVGRHDVEYIRPGGMGVGLSRGEIFERAIEERTIRLNDGDVCVFYTDGITEARNGDEEFGYERLLEAAQHERDLPAGPICKQILESIRVFTENRANQDDLTLVVLKWGTATGSGHREHE